MSLLRLPGREKDPAAVIPLTAREVVGNLVFTGRWVIAWHKAAPVQWPFRPDAARQAWALGAAAQYAQLVGLRIYERATTRPYAVSDWARRYSERTPYPAPLTGEDSWPAFLERRQLAMYGMNLSEKEVYIGVRFARRGNRDVFTEAFGRGRPAERDRVAEEATRIAAALAGGSLNARPTTGTETEFLIHRSVSVGLPVPYDRDSTGTDSWADGDLAGVTDGVWYADSRFGRTVKVTSRRADGEVSQHAAVMTLGKMSPTNTPEIGRSEWLHLLDRLPFPVERISTMDVVGPEDTRKHVNSALLALRDQQKHYGQHDLDVPDDLARKTELAKRVDEQLTDGHPGEATRLVGFHRLVVTGDTVEQAMARVRAVTDAYRNRVVVHVPPVQLPLLRELIPGEPIGASTHLRRYNALFHTSGAPTASSHLGDDVGDLIGTLVGSVNRPVMFDPWLAPEVLDMPGMYPVIGTPGSGKSALMGKLVDSALHRNVPVVILDPSVTFAGLAAMPRWAPHSRVLDLQQAPPGILNPFAVVPTPKSEDYADSPDPELAFQQATKRAIAERFQLVLDICLRLIPPQYRRTGGTDELIRNAVRAAMDIPNASLWDVIRFLREAGGDGPTIGQVLQDVNDMTVEGALFFSTPDDRIPAGNALLTVITIGGLQLPPAGSDEEDWSPSERVAVPLLALAAGYASKLVYSGNRNSRKLLVLDEAHVLEDWPSGRALFRRLARDSRKWDAAVLLAAQNPADALRLETENLVGGAFIGRVADDHTAVEALRLLRVPTGIGYEATVRNLSPVEDRDYYRDFLMLDVYGNVDRMRVTFDDDPGLLAALNTRPGERK